MNHDNAIKLKVLSVGVTLGYQKRSSTIHEGLVIRRGYVQCTLYNEHRYQEVCYHKLGCGGLAVALSLRLFVDEVCA